MGVYLYVQRPLRAASARKVGSVVLTALPTIAMAAWGRLRSRVRPRRANDTTVRTVPTFDARFEAFLERATAAWDVIPLRSVEFLNWRFCDPRAGKFTVRVAEVAGEILGYSVVHAVGARGYIMDLLALPGRLDVVRTLIDDTISQLDEVGTAAIDCWMLREQPYARMLNQAGFVRLPGRSAEVSGEIGWYGGDFGSEGRALLASPDARVHLMHVDFDGI